MFVSMGRKNRKGFTLLESLFAIILIGMAVTALIAANCSFTKINAVGLEISTAEFLAEQIRELVDTLETIDPEDGKTTFGPEELSLALYDDIDDFDDTTFNPPIGADREPLNEFAAYTQNVVVENVSQSDLQQVVGDYSSNFVRITITVTLGGEEFARAMWIRSNY